MTCNTLPLEHQNQWATPCKQGFQGQLEEMQVQSQYSLMISRESLQWQESVKHLPSLLPEHMPPSNSGPTSASAVCTQACFMLIESSVWIPLALEAPNAHDRFHVFWHVATLGKCPMISAFMITYFNHHGFNKLAKLSCLRAWLYEKVSFDAILDWANVEKQFTVPL